MSKTTDILNTKTITYKDQLLVAGLSAAIAVAAAVPFALAVNGGYVSASSPVATTATTSSAATQATGPSCTEPVGSTASSTTSTTGSTSAGSSSGASTNTTTASTNVQSGNSGSGNANNNTTSGSAANNGNTASNSGVVGANAFVPVSLLNNNSVLSNDNVSILNNPLQTVTAQVPAAVTGVTGTLAQVQL